MFGRNSSARFNEREQNRAMIPISDCLLIFQVRGSPLFSFENEKGKKENTLQRGFTKCGAVVGSPKPNTERDNLYTERGAFNLSSAETKKG